MTSHLSGSKGWLQSHPFFLALALLSARCVATTTTPVSQPVTVAPKPTSVCVAANLPHSQRFTLEAMNSGLPLRGQWRDGFAIADMNGDGHADLVHGPARKSDFTPAIFLGDGNGHFERWKSAHFPPLPFDYGDIDVADVNGDGKPDLALSSHLRGLTVLIQEGNGSFAPWASGLRLALPSAGAEPAFTSRAIALVDWNRDQKPDLLALNEGPSRMAARAGSAQFAPEGVALFLNRGGEWEHVSIEDTPRIFGTALATGDVNGDRWPDAIAGSDLAGNRKLLLLGRREQWTSAIIESLPANATVTSAAMFDFDRDRHDELLLGTHAPARDGYCATLDVVRWSPSHETAQRLWSETSRDPIAAIEVADLDGDALDDVIAARQDGTLLLFARTPDGFTSDAAIVAAAALKGCNAYDVHAADVDGDGRAEVIVSYAGETTASGVRCLSGGGFAVWRVNSAR